MKFMNDKQKTEPHGVCELPECKEKGWRRSLHAGMILCRKHHNFLTKLKFKTNNLPTLTLTPKMINMLVHAMSYCVEDISQFQELCGEENERRFEREAKLLMTQILLLDEEDHEGISEDFTLYSNQELQSVVDELQAEAYSNGVDLEDVYGIDELFYRLGMPYKPSEPRSGVWNDLEHNGVTREEDE